VAEAVLAQHAALHIKQARSFHEALSIGPSGRTVLYRTTQRNPDCGATSDGCLGGNQVEFWTQTYHGNKSDGEETLRLSTVQYSHVRKIVTVVRRGCEIVEFSVNESITSKHASRERDGAHTILSPIPILVCPRVSSVAEPKAKATLAVALRSCRRDLKEHMHPSPSLRCKRVDTTLSYERRSLMEAPDVILSCSKESWLLD
jgi:hypothetical protein